MKNMIIFTVLTMILAVNVGKADALDAKKFGPTTIYNPNPEIIQVPLGETKTIVPSII